MVSLKQHIEYMYVLLVPVLNPVGPLCRKPENPLLGARIVLPADTKKNGKIPFVMAPLLFSASQLRSGELAMGARSLARVLIPLSSSSFIKETSVPPLVSFHAVASIIASVQGLYASGHVQ